MKQKQKLTGIENPHKWVSGEFRKCYLCDKKTDWRIGCLSFACCEDCIKNNYEVEKWEK